MTLTLTHVAYMPLQLLPSPGLLKMRRDDPLAFLKLNRSWPRAPGGVREPYAGITAPRPPGATQALKFFLQDRQLGYAEAAHGCLSEVESAAENLWFQVQIKTVHQMLHLLSFSEFGDGFCGGAHPFLIFASYTVKRSTAQFFKPSELWPKLTEARLNQLYLTRFARTDCLDARLTELPLTLQTTLTSQGLALYSDSYAEVGRDCRTVGVTVPYRELRAGANPKSPYYRDIYR